MFLLRGGFVALEGRHDETLLDSNSSVRLSSYDSAISKRAYLFMKLLHEVVDERRLEDEQVRSVSFVEPCADESGYGVLVGVDGELVVVERCV